MTQRVSDEQLARWARSNDSALNDVSADYQDARAEIATLREHLAKVCEAGKDVRGYLACVRTGQRAGPCDPTYPKLPPCGACEAAQAFDAIAVALNEGPK
jgi:hypothetical protein